MTQEEQYILIGKARDSYRQAKKNVALMEAKNREISDVASRLASAIISDPDRIVVLTPETGMIAGRASFVYMPEGAKNLNPDFIREHLQKYKTEKQRLEALKNELIAYGELAPGE
jgi:hypothetical protein